MTDQKAGRSLGAEMVWWPTPYLFNR